MKLNKQILKYTTQDIAKIDQLYTLFRYVKVKTNEQDIPFELEIKESNCGFVGVECQKSADLKKILLDLIYKFTELSKIRCQGYAGVTNICRIYTGLQCRLNKNTQQLNVCTVGCSARTLNPVINNSVSSIPEIRNYFDNLQKVYRVF